MQPSDLVHRRFHEQFGYLHKGRATHTGSSKIRKKNVYIFIFVLKAFNFPNNVGHSLVEDKTVASDHMESGRWWWHEIWRSENKSLHEGGFRKEDRKVQMFIRYSGMTSANRKLAGCIYNMTHWVEYSLCCLLPVEREKR